MFANHFLHLQEGREVSFDICYGNSGYTSGMDAHWQEGMVLIFSQWGEAWNTKYFICSHIHAFKLHFLNRSL